jgi:hypothetical protein
MCVSRDTYQSASPALDKSPTLPQISQNSCNRLHLNALDRARLIHLFIMILFVQKRRVQSALAFVRRRKLSRSTVLWQFKSIFVNTSRELTPRGLFAPLHPLRSSR